MAFSCSSNVQGLARSVEDYTAALGECLGGDKPKHQPAVFTSGESAVSSNLLLNV